MGLSKNVAVVCGCVLYLILLMATCDFLVSRKLVLASTSRKIVHIGAACWVIFWPLCDDVTDGSWRLNVLVPFVKSVELVAKGAIIRDRNDPDVKSISRTGDPTELLYGPFQFTILMITLGLLLFKKPVSCLMMAAAGIGDGIAPIIGNKYGKHKYKGIAGNIKSIEGSVGCFGGTIIGYYFFSWIMGTPVLPMQSLLLASLVAAVVEGLSPSNIDNITVPVAMYFLFNFL